jgi:hypothetical protein
MRLKASRCGMVCREILQRGSSSSTFKHPGVTRT